MDLAGIDVEQARETAFDDPETLSRMIESLGGWSEIADAYFDNANGMLEWFDDDWLLTWIADDLDSLLETLGGLSAVINDIVGLDSRDLLNGLMGKRCLG